MVIVSHRYHEKTNNIIMYCVEWYIHCLVMHDPNEIAKGNIV